MDCLNQMLRESRPAADFDKHELLKEMTHRMNNEYACVVSTISLRAARSCNEEVKVALADAAELLMRFADVHRALLSPGLDDAVEVCAYLRRLCRVISRARLEERNIGLLLVESEPQFLSAERCWKLGLTVSELITNAAKHAVRDSGGTIRIELTKDGDFVRCSVLDNARSRGTATPGQGLKLVRSLMQGAGGTFDCDFGSRGAVSVIPIPSASAVFDNDLLVASANAWRGAAAAPGL